MSKRVQVCVDQKCDQLALTDVPLNSITISQTKNVHWFLQKPTVYCITTETVLLNLRDIQFEFTA